MSSEAGNALVALFVVAIGAFVRLSFRIALVHGTDRVRGARAFGSAFLVADVLLVRALAADAVAVILCT